MPPCSLEWEPLCSDEDLAKEMATLAQANCRTGKDMTKNLSPATASLEFKFRVTNGLTVHNSSDESTLKPSPVSPVHHHLVDICAALPSHSPVHHCPVDICVAFPSHSPIHHRLADICAASPSHSPIHHRPVDICAAFPSHSSIHQIDICNGFHNVYLHDAIFKHPNHKSNFSVPRYPMTRGMQACRQESSLTRRGYCPCSPPVQCIHCIYLVWPSPSVAKP